MKKYIKTARTAIIVGLAGLGMGACSPAEQELAASQISPEVKEDYYAASMLAAQDWSGAAQVLEAREDQDPYRLLNLAMAYQKMGREAEAIALYNKVLELQQNPYANLGEAVAPRRVKNIAKDAILVMKDTDDQP